ncbi:Uncharacterised protein [Mycoplasmopsis canis]|uniref:Uncharacterized protein n=1 Tax=Mycoplasmopsis canis TaxID=29555 RepID=A0A449AQU4_9BACT|nr:Uncharacterised protein [Mycoplasmopsis canis]
MFELYNYNMVDAQTLQTFSILENKNEVMEAKKTY